MRIGVPTEVKADETRVGLLPTSIRELTERGHSAIVQSGAGKGAHFDDDSYRRAGAEIAPSARAIFEDADLIVKVKEPLAEEVPLLEPGKIVFTYLHLAADKALTQELAATGSTCIAYETVTGPNGQLPLLSPMSQVAGRLAVHAAARALETTSGGSGVLIGGVPGVPGARVTVIGGGTVGSNAVEMALGLGAAVTVLDRDLEVLARLAWRFGPALRTVYATGTTVQAEVLESDVVIGAVLQPGARAPRLVDAGVIRQMPSGSVVVDVAIDQGGCFETSRPTTHRDPTYVADGIVHYCVANIPGAVPRTSSAALNNATLPYVIALADKGLTRALKEDRDLAAGLNVHGGVVTEPNVALEHGFTYVPALQAINDQ